MKKTPFFLAVTLLSMTVISAFAATQAIKIYKTNNQICIVSNGIPDHEVGQFPRRGNPHSIKGQKIKFCVTSNPTKGEYAQIVRTVGVAENGVIIRSGAADYFDGSSSRGHSRDRSSGWNGS